jgi:hypothetical protein
MLTMVTGLGLALGEGALAAAERPVEERRVASGVAERLVSAEATVTRRANVLQQRRLADFNGSTLATRYPAVDGYAVRVAVGDAEVATRGDPARGTTIRRLVVVQAAANRTLWPTLSSGRAVTLPRRTGRATVELHPPNGSRVRTVRANDRVLLHNASGLSGRFTVDLSRFETTTLRFQGTGSVPNGSVGIHYSAPVTRKTTLAVTVDA